MVRHAIARARLIELIARERPNWIRRARERTATYARAAGYTGGSEFWGEIKNVYIRLQHEKCAYCETKLQGAVLASKVHEVEHFRPKQSVRAWPDPRLPHLKDFIPSWATGEASASGYHQLAYHPFNYAIACTRCNSTLKSNYFPVRGRREVGGTDPSRMAGEGALLIYPVSDIDDDPRDIVTFDGVLAVPVHGGDGVAYQRAVTTIAFFQLNSEDLALRRAGILLALWMNLQYLATRPSAGSRAMLEAAVERACAPAGEFSSCSAAFRRRFDTDRPAADRIGRLVHRLLAGQEGPAASPA
jgi:hypothetical protein